MIYATVVATVEPNTAEFRVSGAIFSAREQGTFRVKVHDLAKYPVGKRFALVPWDEKRDEAILWHFMEERLTP